MIWVTRIILLAILVAIIRNWPKTSFVIAICIGLIYINSDEKQVDKVENNKIENVQNLNYSNNAEIKSNSNWQNSSYKSNTNRTNYNYEQSKTNTNSYNNYNSENTKVRIGAVCRDGTTSTATGRGACSHHGGVDYWLYE